MTYAPLRRYKKEDDYRLHFKNKYCKESIKTFDGISVRFYESDFKHAFYESSTKKKIQKGIFSISRATRIDWIEKALLDSSAKLYYGWNKQKKEVNPTRRVAIVNNNYAVVIQMTKLGNARFITAFVADSYRTLLLLKNSPQWK